MRAAFLILSLACVVALPFQEAGSARPELPRAPDFTHGLPRDWLNSPPLILSGLRGEVVLVHFWAYQCWNCYRSFPWLNALSDRLAGEPFSIVGVHTPEFGAERDRSRVRAKAREFGLGHPIMIDNDYSYWRALDNRFWPAWYLVGERGRIRGVWVGETRAGDPQARRIEAKIRALLAER